MESTVKKVLIVDDDELSSSALAKRLERRGLETKTLSDGSLVMDLVNQEKFDIVLLDIVMPVVDGLEVLKRIRSQYDKNTLPVIMVTAIDDSSDVVDSFKLGANDYITKPVHIDVALARIYAHLGWVSLNKETIRKKEVEAINAMVVTYNHELNNSLFIAIGSLQKLERNSKELDAQSLEMLKKSLSRTADMVKKIRDLADQADVSYEDYSDGTKMMAIKKES